MRCGKRRCLLTMLFVGVVVAVLIFVVIPLAIYSSSALQSFFIFARFGERILTPEEVGLNATRNFYLAYNDEEFCQPQLCTDVLRREIVLGVWHVLPQSYAESYIKVKDNSTELAEAIHDLLATEVKQFSTIKSTAAEAAEDCDARVRSFDITDCNRTLNSLRSQYFEAALRTGKHPVVLYLHGNGGSRSTRTRIPLYRLLSESPDLDRHVIAVDYRGYGDSIDPPSGPSECGVVRDAIATYAWIAARTPPNGEIIVWGHSLGTGISLQMIRQLQTYPLGELIKGVVLEAPFNNMPDAVREYPLTLPFRHLPWFEATIMRPLADRFPFNSDQHIKHVRQPILILHAPDDRHIPICLAERLRDAANLPRRTRHGVIKFVNVGPGFGHVDIVRYPGLTKVLTDFEREYRSYNQNALINL